MTNWIFDFFPPLKAPIQGACAIQLKPYEFMLVGGNTGVASGFQTNIINKEMIWRLGPGMSVPREGLSCAKLDSSSPLEKPRVIAIGGYSRLEMHKTTESLNAETEQWERGWQSNLNGPWGPT